jgi:hypothetical protein
MGGRFFEMISGASLGSAAYSRTLSTLTMFVSVRNVSVFQKFDSSRGNVRLSTLKLSALTDFHRLPHYPVQRLRNLQSIRHRKTKQSSGWPITARYSNDAEARRRQNDKRSDELESHGQPSIRIDGRKVCPEIGIYTPFVLLGEAFLLAEGFDRA